MKNCLVFLFTVAWLAPVGAQAQYCPNPIPINCGDAVSGDTLSYNIQDNSCFDTTWGFESYYLLELPDPAEVTVRLAPDNEPWTAWNAILSILPELGGDCAPRLCIAGANNGGDGYAETVTVGLLPGRYYLVVDGLIDWDSGPFDLSVDCIPCDNCVDADGDGYPAYDANGCTCGNDCCDAGGENSPGCTPAAAPAIHPGAFETCDDGTDQDCDGQDDPCPACAADEQMACGDAGTASAADGARRVDRYCGHPDARWTAREYIFGFTPAISTTVKFTINYFNFLDQLDVFALRDYGVPGVCNPNLCVDFALEMSGTQRVAFFAEQGEEYFVSVDGRDGSQISFDYTVACVDQACVSNDTIACDAVVSGSNNSGSPNVDAYLGMGWHLLGPEYVYTFTSPSDLWIDITLDVIVNLDIPDLALLVVEDDGSGACLPDHLIVASDVVQDMSSNPPEVVGFHAAAGATYFVVVDGFQANDAGAYSLGMQCQVDCAPGEVQCDFECTDLNTDPANCGDCGTVCVYDHASPLCVGGNCVMGACDSGRANCNSDTQDGCETQLGTLADCSDCDDACQFDHAPASCEEQSCQMGECDIGFADCNSDTRDGCEVNITTAQNCGSCGNACQASGFCYQGNCVSECPGDLVVCDGACIDTSSDPLNCGDCASVCTLANATSTCVDGACAIAACDNGYGDCNDDPSDGCEAALGTNQNCSACGDICEFSHAPGSCEEGLCVMGDCELGWGDCNEQDSDGCESELRSDADNCGSCGNACGQFEICQYGLCTFYCPDEDGDDHNLADCGGSDCDDTDATVYPGAEEICGDEIDQDCDGEDTECVCFDNDGDGYLDAQCGGDDCDDSNGFIYPGAPESCGDGIDQDCDGADLSCNCPDNDGDRFSSAACGGSDCDDGNHLIYPDAPETCGDGIDQNCDGFDLACEGCGCTSSGNFAGWLAVIPLVALLAWRRRCIS